MENLGTNDKVLDYLLSEEGDRDDMDDVDDMKSISTISKLFIPLKQPCRNSRFSGRDWVHELLNGHPARIMENLGMGKIAFQHLCNLLVSSGIWAYKKQQRVDVVESLAIFLHCVTRANKQTDLAERFQHSTETCARHVKVMSRFLVQLAPKYIRHRNINDTHQRILYDDRYYPYFKDCIGAMDGTCISAWAPSDRIEAYRNRKNQICHNVLAVVDHDMHFVYVYTGWEGSAHDCRVWRDAISNQSNGFPFPPTGKYYLVDSGYPNQPGQISPFKGTRYHRSDFYGRTNFAGPKELFNHRHSSCRNIVERAFGVLKKRFPILKESTPPYLLDRQGTIIMTCCVVHNFIRENDSDDMYFANPLNEIGNDHPSTSAVQEEDQVDELPPVSASRSQIREWNAFRESIANDMWASHV